MMDDGPEIISRDQVLSGLAGRRVSTILFAVEGRAAYLAEKARHATAPAICDHMIETRERAFLSALAAGRDLPGTPRIQDLERFAPSLAHLVPDDPVARAGLAHRIGAKYVARADDVPLLRAVLGLDDPDVRRELAARHDKTEHELWASRLPWRDRFRWWRARLVTRLENLSPFWSSYAMTLTQTVGAGILALPIALAGVGPIPGLVLVIVLGLVNVITVASIAEAFTRTGSVRWGGAYLGRVVGQYLGSGAKTVLSVTLMAFAVVALLAYYVGFSSVLSAATGVPMPVWAAGLFLATFGFVWRGRLDAAIASALLVGAVNIAILLLLATLAFTDLDLDNLTYATVPGLGGGAFHPAVLALAFGVVLLAYFGHSSVANGARHVLSREPGGRSLVRGSVAGMATAVVLYSVWLLAVGGAVSATRLEGETGTSLEPLADVTGPAVLVAGAVFAVLAMGMAAVHFSLGLHFQAVDLIRGTGRLARIGAFVPLVVVFLTAELLLITGRESFTGSLGVVGTLAVPLIAGIIPVLLLASARRRGDYVPDRPNRWVGGLPLSVAVYAMFLFALVAYATVIWTAPIGRAAAGAVALVAVAVTFRVLRTDAMHPLANVELRRDRYLGRDRLRVVAKGAHFESEVTVTTEDARMERMVVAGSAELPSRTNSVIIDLAPVAVNDVRVWTHQVDSAGTSEPLDLTPLLNTPNGSTRLQPVDGESIAPLPPSSTLTIDLTHRNPLHGPGDRR